MRSAGILTLGCKVNTYESEYVINKLKENNYEIIKYTAYNTYVKLKFFLKYDIICSLLRGNKYEKNNSSFNDVKYIINRM